MNQDSPQQRSTAIDLNVPILMYHSVADAGPPELAPYRVSPAAFRKQMEFLKANFFYSISLDDLLRAQTERKFLPGRPVVITFDDGYKDFMTGAWPALSDTGFCATIFVVTGQVGSTANWDELSGDAPQLMDWNDLRALRDAGNTIASHCSAHLDLTTLRDDEIAYDSYKARAALRSNLGIDAGALAYPFGRHDARVEKNLRQSGYRAAVLGELEGGAVSFRDDPMRLPRIDISGDDDIATFADKIDVTAASATIVSSVEAACGPLERKSPTTATTQGEYARAETLRTLFTSLFAQRGDGSTTTLTPYRELVSGVQPGFDSTCEVKFSSTPRATVTGTETYPNAAMFSISRGNWFSLEFSLPLSVLDGAHQYQFTRGGRSTRNIRGRSLLRFMQSDGSFEDLVLDHFAMGTRERVSNRLGELAVPARYRKALALIYILIFELDGPTELELSCLNLRLSSRDSNALDRAEEPQSAGLAAVTTDENQTPYDPANWRLFFRYDPIRGVDRELVLWCTAEARKGGFQEELIALTARWTGPHDEVLVSQTERQFVRIGKDLGWRPLLIPIPPRLKNSPLLKFELAGVGAEGPIPVAIGFVISRGEGARNSTQDVLALSLASPHGDTGGLDDVRPGQIPRATTAEPIPGSDGALAAVQIESLSAAQTVELKGWPGLGKSISVRLPAPGKNSSFPLAVPNAPEPKAKTILLARQGSGRAIPVEVRLETPRKPRRASSPTASTAQPVSIVLTSCGRQDLLASTLDSFFKFNTYPIAQFIVVEDGNGALNDPLAARFKDKNITWLATGSRVGQIKAIDLAYSQVTSPFIFHLEDDWEFYRQGFIEKSMKVLGASPDCIQVWIRALDDTNKHPVSPELEIIEGVAVRPMAFDHGDVWHGFTFNPGLRRLADYQRIGSFGKHVTFDPAIPNRAEEGVSAVYRKLGYHAVILADHGGSGYVRHTGYERTVKPTPYAQAAFERGDMASGIAALKQMEFAPIDETVLQKTDGYLADLARGKKVIATTDPKRVPANDEIVIVYGNYPHSYQNLVVNNPIKRHVAGFGEFKYDAVEFDPRWNGVDRIFVINSDSRADRYDSIMRELATARAPLNRVTRIPAIMYQGTEWHSVNGTIGCMQSHMEALRQTEKAGYANVAVLEDDFCFTTDLERHLDDLKTFFERRYDYLLCLLATSKYGEIVPVDDLVCRSHQTNNNTAGYLASRQGASRLLQVYEAAVPALIETRDTSKYAPDAAWSALQETGQFLVFRRKFGFQNSNFSDIEQKITRYLD